MELSDFNLNISDNQYEIMNRLDKLFRDIPGIELQKRFKIPFYYRHSWIAYLNPIKKDGIELCFIYGNEMSNHDGKLDAKKRKQISGISFYDILDINPDPVLDHFHEALILDEEKSNSRKIKK